MSLYAYRAISVSYDAMMAHVKLTPDNYAQCDDIGVVYNTIHDFLLELFPTSQIRDPKNLDYVDRILNHITNGGAFMVTDNGKNILRTVTRPSDISGCIFS